METVAVCKDGVCLIKGEPAVVASGVGVSYGYRKVLCGVDFSADHCTITALIGPSGCGKTTFLSTLNRLTDLSEGCAVHGSVRIAGQEVLAPDADVVALRKRVGMIFQKPNPFPMSIYKNLALPLKHHGVRDRDAIAALVERVLADVGLWEEVKDRLHANALALSGGQQQRLCIARALILNPEILLLDEPCSALDPIASGTVEDLICALKGRLTIVVVTHNLAQARRVSDRTGVFWTKDGVGRLIELGKTEEVFLEPRHPQTAAYVSGRKG